MTDKYEAGYDVFLQEDLEKIVENNTFWKNLENSTILITGATGLIGSLITKTVLCSNRLKNTNIKIIAMIRNEEKARKIFGNLLERENIVLFKCNIAEKIDLPDQVDYIIHCASVTTSNIMISHPVDVIQVAVNGTQNILNLAKEKSVKSMVYLSSMEVYGAFENTPEEKVSEDMLGYINPLKIRSNYPESKRLCENLCVAYAAQYQVPVKIARLAQTFGAGVLHSLPEVQWQELILCYIHWENQKVIIVIQEMLSVLFLYCYVKVRMHRLIMWLMKRAISRLQIWHIWLLKNLLKNQLK